MTEDRPVEAMDPDNGELVFHYKKGSFRRHESDEIRNLATGQNKGKTGFFKVLVSTKGNRFILFALLIIIGVNVFLGFFKNDDTDTVGNVRCTVSAFSFDGKVYCSLNMENAHKKTTDIPVNLSVEFQCINSDRAVADKYETAVTFVSSGSEPVHAVFPDYDMKKIRAVVSDGKEEIAVTSRIVQK